MLYGQVEFNGGVANRLISCNRRWDEGEWLTVGLLLFVERDAVSIEIEHIMRNALARIRVSRLGLISGINRIGRTRRSLFGSWFEKGPLGWLWMEGSLW